VDLPAMSSRIGSIQGDIIQAADTTPFTDIPGFLKGGNALANIQCCRSGTFLTPGSGMGKKSGSGMNNPDHVSESLETIFWVKILKFFDADPGSDKEKIRIRDKHPGSATLLISVAPQ
jgi:hypothetical protein